MFKTRFRRSSYSSVSHILPVEMRTPPRNRRRFSCIFRFVSAVIGPISGKSFLMTSLQSGRGMIQVPFRGRKKEAAINSSRPVIVPGVRHHVKPSDHPASSVADAPLFNYTTDSMDFPNGVKRHLGIYFVNSSFYSRRNCMPHKSLR